MIAYDKDGKISVIATIKDSLYELTQQGVELAIDKIFYQA